MADALPKLSEIRDRAGWSTYTGDQGPLVAAIDAVLALHTPWVMEAAYGQPERLMCAGCDGVLYPCHVRRLIAQHIDVEG